MNQHKYESKCYLEKQFGRIGDLYHVNIRIFARSTIRAHVFVVLEIRNGDHATVLAYVCHVPAYICLYGYVHTHALYKHMRSTHTQVSFVIGPPYMCDFTLCIIFMHVCIRMNITKSVHVHNAMFLYSLATHIIVASHTHILTLLHIATRFTPCTQMPTHTNTNTRLIHTAMHTNANTHKYKKAPDTHRYPSRATDTHMNTKRTHPSDAVNSFSRRTFADPCEIMQSRSISPKRRPPSRARPSIGCLRVCVNNPGK